MGNTVPDLWGIRLATSGTNFRKPNAGVLTTLGQAICGPRYGDNFHAELADEQTTGTLDPTQGLDR